MARIDDVNSKIDATDNYIARYLPLNNFCQMLECCRVTADKSRKIRDKIENYEKYKMKELYDNILFDDGKAPSLF